jgi:hypothetical protein
MRIAGDYTDVRNEMPADRNFALGEFVYEPGQRCGHGIALTLDAQIERMALAKKGQARPID